MDGGLSCCGFLVFVISTDYLRSYVINLGRMRFNHMPWCLGSAANFVL